jgi:hypothetical protein
MGGPVLQEQALQAGVVRVGSGQGVDSITGDQISKMAPILFPGSHYTPNDSWCQVSHRRAACTTDVTLAP